MLLLFIEVLGFIMGIIGRVRTCFWICFWVFYLSSFLVLILARFLLQAR